MICETLKWNIATHEHECPNYKSAAVTYGITATKIKLFRISNRVIQGKEGCQSISIFSNINYPISIFIYSFLRYVGAMGWKIGVLGFSSQRGLGIFLFITMSRTALEPTQPPIQWLPGALSQGEKLTTHFHLVLTSKNVWSYTSTPPICLHGVWVGERRIAYKLLEGESGLQGD
jgi:hypothetical protein